MGFNPGYVPVQLPLMQFNEAGMMFNIRDSWYEPFQALLQECTKFKQLSDYLNQERQKYPVYPPADQVFSWTWYCNPCDVKVVIVGQDPYHGPGLATGLAFSVPYGVDDPPPCPPSLKDYIYEALKKDIPGFIAPQHGNLICWAQQGVLLLNSILTVQDGTAMSHANKGWEEFTDAVIRWLSNNLSGVVFILLGATRAWKKEPLIDKTKHFPPLCAYHPSPKSAHLGFVDLCLFAKCDEYLKSIGKPAVNWHIPPLLQ